MTEDGVEKPLTFDGTNADEDDLKKKVIMLGEVFPADPLTVDAVLKRMGSGLAANLPSRNLDDYKLAAQGRRDCGGASVLQRQCVHIARGRCADY